MGDCTLLAIDIACPLFNDPFRGSAAPVVPVLLGRAVLPGLFLVFVLGFFLFWWPGRSFLCGSRGPVPPEPVPLVSLALVTAPVAIVPALALLLRAGVRSPLRAGCRLADGRGLGLV